MRNPIFLAFAAAFLVIPMALSAQSADIEATATVIPPLNITPARDLTFGEVIPGFAKSVVPADAEAGQFQITGTGTYEVNLDFTLPGNLSAGPNDLPIGFAGGDAAWSGDATGLGLNPFDPNAATQTDLISGELWVYLGGTVTPGASQPAGSYSADVTLTVSYTGS